MKLPIYFVTPLTFAAAFLLAASLEPDKLPGCCRHSTKQSPKPLKIILRSHNKQAILPIRLIYVLHKITLYPLKYFSLFILFSVYIHIYIYLIEYRLSDNKPGRKA